MTIIILIAIGTVAAVLSWGFVRGATRKPTPLPPALDYEMRYRDHPCSRCGSPTGWTWFGRPLCMTCRKREIEAS